MMATQEEDVKKGVETQLDTETGYPSYKPQKVDDYNRIFKQQEEVCLVTGGSGMIGSHIAEELVSRGEKVVVLDPQPPWVLKKWITSGDIIYKHGSSFDTPQVNSIRRQFRVKEIYDFGALLGTEELMPRINSALANAPLGTINIVELAKDTGAKMFYVMTEFSIEPEYAEFCDGYQVSKHAAQDIVREYKKIHGIDAVLARVHHIFSSRQQLIPQRKLLPTLIAYGLTGTQMKLFGDITRRFDFVYGGDVARIVVNLVKSTKRQDIIYDIGGSSDNFWSLKQTAEQVINTTKSKGGYTVLEDIRKQAVVSVKAKNNWSEDKLEDEEELVKLSQYLSVMVEGFRKRFTWEELKMAVIYMENRFRYGV